MDTNLRNRKWKVSPSRALAFVGAIALALGLGLSVHGIVLGQQSEQAPIPSPSDFSRAFINVAKKVGPAVVNIDVREKVRQSAQGFEDMPQIPGFRQFQIPQQQVPQRGTGSGVIISQDGYILTNNHVAGNADLMKVTLADGREFKARRVGTDPETDLAVIKIDAENLPYAKLGDSDKLEQGEWVVALGSPFGLQKTMTAGIVSATGRALQGTYDNYIQTDASINPGNSGGPLVNMSGDVIGINTMIVTRSGGSEGIGFSIPSNMAHKVYAELIRNGKVTRGYLGVSLQPITPAVAREIKYNGTEGALVGDVTDANSPAARAGLLSGDVITEFDGRPVASRQQLVQMVADTQVGKSVPVKYVRDGRVHTTAIKLAERPDPDAQAARPSGGDEGRGSAAKLGISVGDVTPDLVRQLHLKSSSGAVIDDVQPGSPAQEAGLQQGDVIHRIGSTTVSNAQGLIRAVRQLGSQKEVVLQVERGGQLSWITVPFD
jgi:serine protease Do